MATFYNQATLSYNNTTVSSNIVSGEVTEVLTAEKTAVSASYTGGGTITYAVSLVNSGSAPVTGITLTDDLGAYEYNTLTLIPLTYITGSVLYFVNGALQPAPTVSVQDDALVFSGLNVPANGSAIIIYQAEVNEFAPLGSGSSITNTVTADGSGAPAITASAEVPVSDEAVLSISKALSPSSVTENSRITYTFIIQNTGNTAESTAVISDTFDPALTAITVSVNGAPSEKETAYTYDETTGEFATVSGALTIPAATYTRVAGTGEVVVVPGTAEVTVTGTI
ncbi:MAG: hypothetical protein J6X60_05075 [Ruminiclostridium sp.]|nr:hypothetical protein [Ruminiclostridium sp.]